MCNGQWVPVDRCGWQDSFCCSLTQRRALISTYFPPAVWSTRAGHLPWERSWYHPHSITVCSDSPGAFRSGRLWCYCLWPTMGSRSTSVADLGTCHQGKRRAVHLHSCLWAWRSEEIYPPALFVPASSAGWPWGEPFCFWETSAASLGEELSMGGHLWTTCPAWKEHYALDLKDTLRSFKVLCESPWGALYREERQIVVIKLSAFMLRGKVIKKLLVNTVIDGLMVICSSTVPWISILFKRTDNENFIL